MPWKQPTPCRWPGCPKLGHGGRCEDHKSKRTGGPRREAQGLRKTQRFQRARLRYLREHPLCAEHLRRGETVAATDLDHVKPHRGDAELFWDEDNWQGLCVSCHRRKSLSEMQHEGG